MLDTCRHFAWVLLILSAPGCAMCVNSNDFTYPASGGRWQRVDPVFGRVGSAFTPEVGVKVEDPEARSGTPASQPNQPTPAINALDAQPDIAPDASVLEEQAIVSP